MEASPQTTRHRKVVSEIADLRFSLHDYNTYDDFAG